MRREESGRPKVGWRFGVGVAGSGALAVLVLAGIAGCGQPAIATAHHIDGVPPTTSTHRTAPSGTARSQATRVRLPGVIADCTAPPPAAQKATVRPVSIILACADDGLGVEDLHWTMWTAGVAVGTGWVWENECTPDCAAGVVKSYSATVTLSGVVMTRADGVLFSELTVTYRGLGPQRQTSSRFPLPLVP